MLQLSVLLIGLTPSVSAIEPVSPPLSPIGPVPVAAAGRDEASLSWTYAEANYVWFDSEDLNDTFDGFELTGSFQLPLVGFFVQGTGRWQSADSDLTTYVFGLGYHIGFAERFDAYGILNWTDVEVDGGGFNFSDDGVGAEAGVRMLVVPSFEVNGRFRWTDIDNTDESIGVGARFYFMQHLSVGANIDMLGDDELITAGVRLGF